MPDFAQHLEQAKHNKTLLSALKTLDGEGSYADWYVTISFYTAVHAVEGMIFKSTKLYLCSGPNDRREGVTWVNHAKDAMRRLKAKSMHQARKLIVMQNHDYFKDCYDAYATLDSNSRVARYECQSPCTTKVHDTDADLDQILKQFSAGTGEAI